MSWLCELSQMIQFLLTRIDVFLQGLISSCILKLFVAKKVLVTRNYWLSQKIYFYWKSFLYIKLFPEWEIYFLWKNILFWHGIILVAEYIPVWTCVRIVKDKKVCYYHWNKNLIWFMKIIHFYEVAFFIYVAFIE